MKKKRILFPLIIMFMGIFFLINYTKANSAPPMYVDMSINWIGIISAFAIGTTIEIIIGYFFLGSIKGWLKALVIANIFSYPVFVGILTLNGGLSNIYQSSIFSNGGIFSIIIVFGEIIVVLIESLIIKKVLEGEISFAKSLGVALVTNLVSWILGGLIIYSLWSDKFPYLGYKMTQYYR
jgi:hypothetical protein